MKKKLVAVMMCAAMVAMLGVGCGSKSSDDSSSKSETKKTLTEDDIKDSMKGVKLKVGTTGLFGPFSYYDEDGKTLIGYDLDLINDLQDLLGFEIDGVISNSTILHRNMLFTGYEIFVCIVIFNQNTFFKVGYRLFGYFSCQTLFRI